MKMKMARFCIPTRSGNCDLINVCARGSGMEFGAGRRQTRNFSIPPKSALASGSVVGFLTGFGIEN